MSARPKTLLAAALLSGALALATGCGGEDEEGAQIPRDDAAALINRLEEAQRRSDPFRCNDMRKDTIPALERQVAALPENVDADVRSTVEDGIAHLSQLVEQECEANEETKTEETTPTPEPEPEPAPTPTQTQPPETTPEPTTPTPEPEPEPAPEVPGTGGTPGNNGNGNGNGGARGEG